MPVLPADLPAEFEAVDPDIAQMWIDAATCAIDPVRFCSAGMGHCVEVAIKLKASHLLKVAGEGSGPAVPANAITSESRGGKSVTRAASGGASGPHGSSSYGQALDNILDRVDKATRRYMPPRPQPC